MFADDHMLNNNEEMHHSDDDQEDVRIPLSETPSTFRPNADATLQPAHMTQPGSLAAIDNAEYICIRNDCKVEDKLLASDTEC